MFEQILHFLGSSTAQDGGEKGTSPAALPTCSVCLCRSLNPDDLHLPPEPQTGGPRISKAGDSLASSSKEERGNRKGKKDEWEEKEELSLCRISATR